MTRRHVGRALGAALLAAAAAACADIDNDAVANAFGLTGGNAHLGKVLIRQHGCGSCHTIPGVPGAHAMVGPPLSGMAARAYIAGVVPNTPDNLVRWIESPQEIDPRTAMPDVGLTTNQARDVAAYLYTLRGR